MNQNIETEQEWYSEAKNMLSRLGVNNPTVGEDGSIPVSPEPREVISVNVSESTPTRRRVLNQLPRTSEERLLIGGPKVLGDYGDPLCNNLNCRILSILPRECSRIKTTWTEPFITTTALPNEIPSATAYLNPFNARIEGDAEFEFINNSNPGEKHTQEIFKCQSDGPKETEVIEDSSIVDGSTNSELIDRSVGEKLDDVSYSWSDVNSGSSPTAQAGFYKGGALSVLESIYNAWTQGYMEARAQATLDVEYDWRGSTNKKQFDIDADIRIPVTNLNYSW